VEPETPIDESPGSAPPEKAASQVAIVTGAARGIAAAIASRLAQDGCDIAAVDLDEASCAETVAAVRRAGRRALAVAANVADESAAVGAVKRVAAELGSPTVLINNAGVLRDHITARMTVAEWDTVMEVNLRGTFLMTRETQPHMREAMWG
jgi:3-oxoacyl-[acyl-carrier protein] reductase